MPEVLGGCGLMFDPCDPKDMAKQMGLMLTDDALRGRYVKLGLTRVKMFDWGVIAHETIKVYREVMGNE